MLIAIGIADWACWQWKNVDSTMSFNGFEKADWLGRKVVVAIWHFFTEFYE